MGRPKGAKNIRGTLSKLATKDFFAEKMDDATEEAQWRRFMASENEDLAAKMFVRYVEYKRGKPIQPIAGPNGGPIPLQIVTNATLPHVN